MVIHPLDLAGLVTSHVRRTVSFPDLTYDDSVDVIGVGSRYHRMVNADTSKCGLLIQAVVKINTARDFGIKPCKVCWRGVLDV